MLHPDPETHVAYRGGRRQAARLVRAATVERLAARTRGLPGQAIAWGAWSGLGEAEEQRERITRQRSAFGGGWFSPQQGLRALDRLVRDDPATAVVMAVDWPVFAEAIESRPPLLEDLLAAATEAETETESEAEDLPGRVRAAPAAEREGLLVSFLQREVQAVLRLPSTPAQAVGFFELGMDSLMAVELRNRLNRAFADVYTAPNTLVLDYPDIATLARHLAAELGAGDATAGEVTADDAAVRATVAAVSRLSEELRRQHHVPVMWTAGAAGVGQDALASRGRALGQALGDVTPALGVGLQVEQPRSGEVETAEEPGAPVAVPDLVAVTAGEVVVAGVGAVRGGAEAGAVQRQPGEAGGVGHRRRIRINSRLTSTRCRVVLSGGPVA